MGLSQSLDVSNVDVNVDPVDKEVEIDIKPQPSVIEEPAAPKIKEEVEKVYDDVKEVAKDVVEEVEETVKPEPKITIKVGDSEPERVEEEKEPDSAFGDKLGRFSCVIASDMKYYDLRALEKKDGFYEADGGDLAFNFC